MYLPTQFRMKKVQDKMNVNINSLIHSFSYILQNKRIFHILLGFLKSIKYKPYKTFYYQNF